MKRRRLKKDVVQTKEPMGGRHRDHDSTLAAGKGHGRSFPSRERQKGQARSIESAGTFTIPTKKLNIRSSWKDACRVNAEERRPAAGK